MFSLSKNVLNWLDENKNCDYRTLILKAGGNEERRKAVVRQEARRRASLKLPKFAGNQDFVFPSVLSVEQSTNQQVALFHASMVKETDNIVDLTCGLGIDAMSMAAKAKSVTAIDMNAELVEALEHNCVVMGIDNITVVEADSMEWLGKSNCMFDLAFIDPYRRDERGKKVVRFSDCSPNIVSNLQLILLHCKKLIVKASPMHDISLALQELNGHAESVKIVGSQNECFELLLVLTNDVVNDVTIESVTILPTGETHKISWIYGECYQTAKYTMPKPGDFVYELWPAAMKGGAYDMIAELTGTSPISVSTHVFSSADSGSEFPGKKMKVLEVIPYGKSAIKFIKANYSYLNIATRNFPIPAAELEKRLGVKPGGNFRLLGVRDSRNKPYLIILEPT